jgi:hypothetical protein
MILGIDVGQKNLGVCVWNPESKTIAQWAVWDSAGTWAQDVCACLQKNATDEFLQGVTRVVIEHQPSKNPSMTRIMHYLEFYFTSRDFPVSLQDSKHKLLYATTTEWFPKDSTDREWTYRHRKKLAVDTVTTFLEKTIQPLADTFTSSKKKDDLADSLLHAMAYSSFGVLGGGIGCSKKNTTKKKVVARAPTSKQLQTGRLSASNVKYLLRDSTDISGDVKKDPRLQRALKKHFGTVAEYLERIKKKPSNTT